MIYTATTRDRPIELTRGGSGLFLLVAGTEYEILDGRLIVRRWADDSDDEEAFKRLGVGRGEPLIFDDFDLAIRGHIIESEIRATFGDRGVGLWVPPGHPLWKMMYSRLLSEDVVTNAIFSPRWDSMDLLLEDERVRAMCG